MVSLYYWTGICFNTLGLIPNDRRFAGSIFQMYFNNWNYSYIEWNFIRMFLRSHVYNKSLVVQIITWHQRSVNSLSETQLHWRIYASLDIDVLTLNIPSLYPIQVRSRPEVLCRHVQLFSFRHSHIQCLKSDIRVGYFVFFPVWNTQSVHYGMRHVSMWLRCIVSVWFQTLDDTILNILLT